VQSRSVRVAEVAARAGAHGGGEQERERCRPVDRARSSVFLQGLPQGSERSATEGREVVQEQHAAARQRHLARRLPADEGRRPDARVRRSEGRAAGSLQPRSSVDLPHRGRLVSRPGRQQAGQATGEHRLAYTARAGQQYRVAAGSGDLQGALGRLQPVDVGEVRGCDEVEGCSVRGGHVEGPPLHRGPAAGEEHSRM